MGVESTVRWDDGKTGRWDGGGDGGGGIYITPKQACELTVPRLEASDVAVSCVSAGVSDHAETYRRT
jgi:hypothetical protein